MFLIEKGGGKRTYEAIATKKKTEKGM